MIMTASKELIAFDLDDTLAASKSAVDPSMARMLEDLLEKKIVAIISGGRYEQFETQVLAYLKESAPLDRLHIMPTCGTTYYQFTNGQWEQQYAEYLSVEEQELAMKVLKDEAKHLGLWEDHTWGDRIENRGSQITFSALGQSAPVDAKKMWDPQGEKKNALRDAVQVKLPTLEVRSGGSTSVDITRKGIDKAYGMRKIEKATGIPLEKMLFIGDRLDPHGNDYPVKSMGVDTIAINNPEETMTVIEQIIAQS